MQSVRSSLDLAATMALAILGLFAALIPVDTWLRVVLVSPMVLLLPGYAVTAIVFLPRTLPVSERLVYTIALSLAATALIGVAVQLVLGLDRTVWAIALPLVILAATWMALARRRRNGVEWTPPRAPLAVYLKPAALIAMALAIAIGSIAMASHGAREERDDIHFTQLWALPAGPGKVSVGVSNEEGAPASYELEILSGGDTLASSAIDLADGDSKRVLLSVPPISAERPLKALLLKDGRVYRRVQLNNEALP
jgi:uncharacterized membrane protein